MTTRHDCGFAAFQCDPDTCAEPCFTARVIDLDARHQPAKPVLPTRAMAAILAASLAFISFYAVSALVDRGMENIADYRAAHAPV